MLRLFARAPLVGVPAHQLVRGHGQVGTGRLGAVYFTTVPQGLNLWENRKAIFWDLIKTSIQ